VPVRDIPRVVWILAASRFANAAGSFVYFFLFLYLTGPRELSLGLAGVIAGGMGVGMLAGNFTGGWFGDRFGHRRTLLLASGAAGLGTIAIPWFPVPVLAAAVPLISYAAATAAVSQGALVAVAVPPGDRRRAIAITRAAFNAGCIIGPPIGALLSTYDFTLVFVIDGVVTLAVRAAVARLLPAELPASIPTGESPGLWRSLRADRSLLLFLPAVVVIDIVYRQLYSTLPVFLRDQGQPVGLYAALIALGSGAILVLEIPVTLALRRLPATGIVAAGYGLVGLGFAVFGLGPAVAAAITAMTIVTAGEILYKTTATARVLDAAPPGLAGRYQGLYTGAATSGTMLAPPLGAMVYAATPGLLWPLCAAAAAGAATLAWASGRLRPAVDRPAEDHPAAMGAIQHG
jgi:predicted MFS family arabinose efflux permease